MASTSRSNISSSSSNGTDTSEDEDEPTVTQVPKKSQNGTKKRAKRSKVQPEELTPIKKKCKEAEMNKLVHDCVYYLLIADQKKYAVKRTDILKHVLKNKEQKKMFNSVMLKAKDCLKKVYGINVVQLEGKKGQYLLVNHTDKDGKELKIGEYSEKESASRGLLLYVLTVIYMKEHAVSEEELWEGLKVLELDVESGKIHPFFGDVKKCITQEFVRQMYVTYNKTNNTPVEYEFAWGPRAHLEVDKEEMLDFVAEVYGNTPADWLAQHKEINDSKQ